MAYWLEQMSFHTQIGVRRTSYRRERSPETSLKPYEAITQQPKRRGARSSAAIPDSILAQLNAGILDTATLAEWLAVDMGSLFGQIVAFFDLDASVIGGLPSPQELNSK